MHDARMSIGIITGASRGLGLALTRALASRDWTLVVDARDEQALAEATRGLDGVVAVAGDVTDPRPRARLVAEAGGGIDLVVNNASATTPSRPRVASASACSSRASTTSVQPRAASARVSASPSPRDAPVMMPMLMRASCILNCT